MSSLSSEDRKAPQKRPRGRPRKDGRPAGSVLKVAAPAKLPKPKSELPIDGTLSKRGRGRPRKTPIAPNLPAQGDNIPDRITLTPQTFRSSPQEQLEIPDQLDYLEEPDTVTKQSEESPVFFASQTEHSSQSPERDIFWGTYSNDPDYEMRMQMQGIEVARQRLQCKQWAEDSQRRLQALADFEKAARDRWELKYGVVEEVPKRLGEIDESMFPQLAIDAERRERERAGLSDLQAPASEAAG